MRSNEKKKKKKKEYPICRYINVPFRNHILIESKFSKSC